MSAEEEAVVLLKVSKDSLPYGSLDADTIPIEGYCMVFEVNPQYGFGRNTEPYQIEKKDGTLKVVKSEDINSQEYKDDKWEEKVREWNTDRNAGRHDDTDVASTADLEHDLLRNFNEANIQYKIIPDRIGKYWYVVITTQRSKAQKWAEQFHIDLPIDPVSAVTVGQDYPGFHLAKRTALPNDPVKTFEIIHPKSTQSKPYPKLELKYWNNIHIGYHKTVPEEVYLKEDGKSVINHRLYLRLLYEMLTESTEMEGAQFIVEKHLNDKYHPLKYFFALHDPSASWSHGILLRLCKCNLFYDTLRRGQSKEEKAMHTKPCCTCDVLGNDLSLRFCDTIRDYYGESIGFYFEFLMHYTKWLKPMAALGVIWFAIQTIGSAKWGIATPGSTVIVLIAIMWSTIMIENWYRREWKLRFQWGMMSYKETEVPRPSFSGKMTVSKETGELIETYKNWYSYCCKITFSMSTMVLCVAIVVVIVATLFLLRGQNRHDQVLTIGIGMANSIQIFIMNKLYTWLAIKLNEWEGHRLQQDYYNNLVIKRIIFIVFNSFYSLFYIGFFDDNPVYDDDEVRLEAIRTQLVTLFLMAIFLQNTMEVLFPFLSNQIMRICAKKEQQEWNEEIHLQSAPDNQSDALLHDKAQSVAQGVYVIQAGVRNTKDSVNRDMLMDIERQLRLSPSPDVLDNTAEIVVLHGYIMLFVIIFPLMPFLALVNNYLELRVDFYNLITAQRPIPASAAGLGVWKSVLASFNIVAVFSNLAIVAFRTPLIHNLLSSFGEEYDTTVNITIFYFSFALLLLFIIFTIRFVIDDKTVSTREAIARQDACERHLLMAPPDIDEEEKKSDI